MTNPEIRPNIDLVAVPLGLYDSKSGTINGGRSFSLERFGRITGEAKYRNAAELLAKGLMEAGWNQKKGQFNRGQRSEGPDEVMALDCASWGALFMLSRDEKKKALLAVK